MADIQLRFNKDMLVITSPVTNQLMSQDVDSGNTIEMMSIVEDELTCAAYKLQDVAGVQCFCTHLPNITQSHLAHSNMTALAQDLANQCIDVIKNHKPQHLFVEIAPCMLALDPSSQASINQSQNQYAQAAKLFDHHDFDAYYLNGMLSLADLRCAVLGVRQVSTKPIMACVKVANNGSFLHKSHTLQEIVTQMHDLDVDAFGVEVQCDLDTACDIFKQLAALTTKPLIAQINVAENNPKQLKELPENPYFCADIMVQVASRLRAQGVQFLRAVGNATPAYAAALVIASQGFDVKNR